MKKRVSILALLLCLLLTACSGKARDGQGQVSFLGKAAGLSEDMVLLTIDGREIPAWRYLYWLAYTCDAVREQYQEAGVLLDWKAPVSGGTLADYAKDQALVDTALYAIVENWTEQYGCVITEADLETLAESWTSQVEAHGGEAAYLAELAELGLDRERAEALAKVGIMYAKLCDLCRTEGSDLSPDSDALAAFAAETGSLTMDRILVPVGEERESAYQRATEVFSQLNNAEEQAQMFAALAKEAADPKGPRTIQLGDGTLDKVLEEAAKALEEGQISGILESDEGFSIIRRLTPERAALIDDYFDQMLQNAAKKAIVEVTPEYEQLDPIMFDQKLESLRKEKPLS